MNKRADAPLLAAATGALQALGLTATERRPPRATGAARGVPWLRVGRGRAATDHPIVLQRRVTPATLGALVAQLRALAAATDRPALLVADHVTPPLAEQLRAARQPFADAAGNAYLEDRGLLVYVVGRRPPPARGVVRTGAAFTVNGLKILFALLCTPELAARPQREIAAAAGVALGAVPGALADLQHAGHLLVAGDTRRLNAGRRLLDEWALAYAQRLRPKTQIALYTAAGLARWKDWRIDPRDARWGGEPAAQLLVRTLNPGVLTLYAPRLPPKLMVEQRLVPARPSDAPPYLELRKPFWGESLPLDTRVATVPPVLVYADLLATGDARCIEAAQRVYDDRLARLLPAG